MIGKPGGLITNGRTQQPQSDIPQASPMKPIQQQAPPQPAPQAAPQQAMQQQGQPGMEQPPQQPGMGQPQGDPGAQGQPGVNHLASNALKLLHDPEASKEFEQMISQGPQGAAQAVVMIGEQVIQAHQQNGAPIDEQQATDATIELIQDVGEIGLNQGYLQPEPVIDGVPASVTELFSNVMQMWGEKFPEFAEEMSQTAQSASPQEQASAQQFMQHLQQGQQQ